ncbi:MAG: hypothetical protein AAF682_22790 [Planctomycetota bacterium]
MSLALTAPLAAQGTVHVVDDDGGAGVDFTQVQAAVTAAAECDTILVREGVYAPVSIEGKGLTIVAEAGEAPSILGTLEITPLAEGQWVTIRGLDVVIPLGFGPVQVASGAGAVLFEDCDFRNGNLGQFGFTASAVLVEGSERVAFVACSFEGSAGGLPAGGGHGLVVRDAGVHLYDSVGLGGEGATGATVDAGDAVWVEDGFVFASGCELTGGAGGKGVTLSVPFPPFQICYDGGQGGNGLTLTGASPAAVLLDGTFIGGVGGGSPPGCSTGASGAATEAPPGQLQLLSGSAHSFTATSPVREFQRAELCFAGLPGEQVVAVLGFAPDASFFPALAGTLLVETGSAQLLSLGSTGRGGTLSLQVQVPPFLGTGQGATLLLQPIFVDGGGAMVLGGASALVVLSQSI